MPYETPGTFDATPKAGAAVEGSMGDPLIYLTQSLTVSRRGRWWRLAPAEEFGGRYS